MNRQGFPRRRLHRMALLGALAIAVPAIAACGSSSSGAVSAPVIGAAKTFSLAGFEPATKVVPGKPTTVSFTIQQPNGKPLTAYKTGSGPHTGVHLIIVRDDLAYIIHQHPPVGANGLLRQTVTFPAPGRYRVLVDAYPNIPGGQPNFQLFKTVNVTGAYHPKALPPFTSDQTVDGYHIDMQGHPTVHAIQAQFVHVDVTDPNGKQGHVRALVRRARARDLLSPGIAGLLPHPHLRAQRPQLRRAPRRHRKPRGRHIHGPGEAHDRRAAAGAGHLAPVLADEARRPRRDRSLHAEGGVVSAGGVWVRLLASLVALGAGVAALVIAILLVHTVLG